MKVPIRNLIRLLLVSMFFSQANSSEFHHGKFLEQFMVHTFSNLAAIGVDKIDGQDVSKLKDRISGIRLDLVPEVLFQDENNRAEGVARNSGQWNRNDRSIQIAQNQVKTLNSAARTLIYHETFGVIGVKDDNFSRSSLLSTLEQADDIQRQRPDAMKLQKGIKILKDRLKIESQGGGVTGVGGGGDIAIASYMWNLTWELFVRLVEQRITSEQFHRAFDCIEQLNIEVWSDALLPQGTYAFSFRHKFLRIPRNAFYGPNIQSNQDAIQRLANDLMLTPFIDISDNPSKN